MSPLQNAKKVLDEGVLAKGYIDHASAPAQEAVWDEDNESLNAAPSPNQLSKATPPCEKNRTTNALQDPSAKSTTDCTIAQDRNTTFVQASSEQLSSVPENDSSALDIFNRPPLMPTELPISSEKTGSQDQDDGHNYPEGGLRAWLVVLGAFSGMTASFGNLNSTGTFQAYVSTHQLAHESPSAIGWIFSLYAFLTFFCGVQIGPVFDAYGPRWLVFAGTVCLFGGMMGVAESTSKCCLLLHIVLWPSPTLPTTSYQG